MKQRIAEACAALRRLGLRQLFGMLAAFLLVMCFAAPRWEAMERPELYGAWLSEENHPLAPEGTRTLHLSGSALYRINTLHVDGRRVPVRFHEAVSYSECVVCVDEGVFAPGKSCRIAAGKRYFLPPWEFFRSNTITFEAGPEREPADRSE